MTWWCWGGEEREGRGERSEACREGRMKSKRREENKEMQESERGKCKDNKVMV